MKIQFNHISNTILNAIKHWRHSFKKKNITIDKLINGKYYYCENGCGTYLILRKNNDIYGTYNVWDVYYPSKGFSCEEMIINKILL